MANLDAHDTTNLKSARQQARHAGHVHHAQLMLMAAGMAAAGIVAVAATMMATLL